MTCEPDLEGRASSGDADARFQLGSRLMRAPDSPDEASRGIELMESAAAQGHAEAVERSALFEVMGIGRPPSWDRALDRLLRAAELGSASAQSQLLLLSGEEAGPAGPHDWPALRSLISVERLLEVGERQPVSEMPRIRSITAFITPGQCRWLIESARERLQPATIFDDRTGTLRLDPARSNRGIEFQIMDMDLITELVRTRISIATKLPLPIFETTQVLHYSVGQEFKPHYDFLDPGNAAFRDQIARFGQRIATFLIYLNEDFEGGETDFPKAGLRLRCNAGDALFFANVDRSGKPDLLTLHAGLPPTSGEKWIFSQWIRDRSPKP